MNKTRPKVSRVFLSVLLSFLMPIGLNFGCAQSHGPHIVTPVLPASAFRFVDVTSNAGITWQRSIGS